MRSAREEGLLAFWEGWVMVAGTAGRDAYRYLAKEGDDGYFGAAKIRKI
jgi:hypothetical protein